MSDIQRGPSGGSPHDLAELGATLAARSYAKRGMPMSSETIRVVLADDHAMVREGLRLVLRTARDIAVVGEADDGVTALKLASRLTPDVVVLDLDMPGATAQRPCARSAISFPLHAR